MFDLADGQSFSHSSGEKQTIIKDNRELKLIRSVNEKHLIIKYLLSDVSSVAEMK
jgi:hypothetical protein